MGTGGIPWKRGGGLVLHAAVLLALAGLAIVLAGGAFTWLAGAQLGAPVVALGAYALWGAAAAVAVSVLLHAAGAMAGEGPRRARP